MHRRANARSSCHRFTRRPISQLLLSQMETWPLPPSRGFGGWEDAIPRLFARVQARPAANCFSTSEAVITP